MSYTINEYTGNGSQTQFALNFTLGILSRDNVTCRVGTEVDGLGDPLYRELEWITDGLVNVVGTPAGVGVPVKFVRTVDKDVLIHDYTDGATIQEENLDQSNLQLMMAVHELLDGRLAPLGEDLDLAGNKIINLAAGVADTDAANMAQLNDVLDQVGDISDSVAAAAASAEDAADQVVLAAAQVTLAEGQVTLATDIKDDTAAIYDAFDDRYLGAKVSDPTTDNDGNALLVGAVYFNSVSGQTKIWSGTVWTAINPPFNISSQTTGNLPANRLTPPGSSGQVLYNNAGALDASTVINQNAGKVGFGTASPQNLNHLHNASAAAVFQQFTNSVTGVTGSDGLVVGLDAGGQAIISQQENNNLNLYTNGTERMRINGAGQILINGGVSTNPHFGQAGDMSFLAGRGPLAWNTLKTKLSVTTVALTGTYTQSGTTLITVTMTAHGLTTGDYVQLDFTTGTATDMGGYCTVVNANTFTVIGSTSVTTSGNVTKVSHTQPVGMPFAISALRVTTGQITVYFNAAVFPDANYGLLSAGGVEGGSQAGLAHMLFGATKNTSQCTVTFVQTGTAIRDVTNFIIGFL